MSQFAEKQIESSLSVMSGGAPISQLKVYVNPMMRGCIIAYQLMSSESVKIEITNKASKKKVKDLFFPAGNSGGRRGINKVLWDGSNNDKLKCPYGMYEARLFIKDIITEPIDIRF